MSPTVIIIGSIWLVGAVVSRTVLKRHRERLRAEGKEVPEPNRKLGLAILGLMVFAFAVVLGPGMLAEYRHDQLVETGKPATARITAVEETGNVYNRRPEVEVKVRVQPDAGEAFSSSETWVFSVMDVQSYRVGTELDVFYDPADTSTVAIVGPAS